MEKVSHGEGWVGEGIGSVGEGRSVRKYLRTVRSILRLEGKVSDLGEIELTSFRDRFTRSSSLYSIYLATIVPCNYLEGHSESILYLKRKQYYVGTSAMELLLYPWPRK